MRRIVFHNFGLKLLAVIIALFLWMLISGESQAVRVYPARIDFLYPQDQVLSGDIAGTVSVYLRGPELVMRSLDAGSLAAVIDLRGGAPGPRRVVLDPQRNLRGVTPGLSVERIVPQVLNVKLERKLRRALSVAPNIVGEPPEGCRQTGYDIIPSEVLVEGPESQLREMESVQTEPVDISGRCRPFMLPVLAVPDRPGVRLVSQKAVTLTVRIEPAEPEAGRRPRR